MMQRVSDVTALQAYLAAQDDVALAYLFGSRARDQAAPESDYDIAILTRPAISPARRYQLSSELSAALGGAPVDLVVLNRAPVELAYAVIAEGRRLFEREVVLRVEFEADVLSRYGDFVYTRREQRTDLLRGGAYEAEIRRHRAALGKTERVLAEVRAAARQDAG
jgi:predicted nucleotidyltransferase